MMKRHLAGIAMVVILCCVSASSAKAHPSAAEHWQDLRYVFFGKRTYSSIRSEAKSDWQAIEQASQICIDQFGGSHKSMLESVKRKTGLLFSISIEQIDLFARGTNHRCYTHRGWDYSYQDDAENGDWVEKRWPKRKDILRETAEAVFNFNGLPRLLDGFVGYNERCEGFCKLVYYVHLLGDHIEFTTYTFNRAAGSELGHEQVIPLGASRGNSLISEIIEVFPVLFPEQDYSELERSLTAANLKVCSILNKPDDLKTDEGFQQYHEAAVEILDILHDYLPKLLRNEVFFNNVFYK